MSLKTIAFFVLAAVLGGAVTSFAMQKHGSDKGGHMMSSSGGIPSETGQSAFAAIAEIVRILDADPETDWSKVNISTLRDHLVDMNNLTLNANVEKMADQDGVTFIITGGADTKNAIQTMVTAHAKELDKMADWSASTRLEDNGVRLIMKPKSEALTAKILGLGFFGLMATGSHHQPHHLGMANGQMSHH